jgi:peptide chain release factor 1
MTDSFLQETLLSRLAEMARREDEIVAEMSRPEVFGDHLAMQRLGRQQRGLQDPVRLYRELESVLKELDEVRTLLEDGADPEFRELAREDFERLEARRERLFEEAGEALRPRDPNDERNVIIEIRSAEGGAEAGLWAANLMRMYLKYAELRGWKVEMLNTNETEVGGIREVSFEIRGEGAYSRLKFESGVHRVQRVPETEASGRIHTSTATVAVMPEVDEVELEIKDEDLKIDVFRSSGHGGQSVNTTDSAVRITHLPTGEVVQCQDERSQLKNKIRAMAVLRARLYERELATQSEAVSKLRRSQVGRGERAEKIRTYNFRVSRVTDHRIGLTVHNLPALLEGQLDPLIDALAAADRAEPPLASSA